MKHSGHNKFLQFGSREWTPLGSMTEIYRLITCHEEYYQMQLFLKPFFKTIQQLKC